MNANKKQVHKALKSAAFFAAYILAFALVWVIAYSVVQNEYVFPSLWQVVKETGALFTQSFFYRSFLQSLLRVALAFSISFICAAACAVLAKIFSIIGRILAPIVSAFRALPTMAIMLILLIWTTPKSAPVIVAFLALFPMLYTGVVNALSAVDGDLEEMCRVYRVPVKKRVFAMYLPISAPYILREAASGAAFALKLVVSAEVLASTYTSLGGMMQLSKIYMQTAQTFALAIVVIVVGLIVEGGGVLLARLVERRVK